MSGSNADSGRNFSPSGKFPSCFNLFSACKRQSRAESSGGLWDSCGGSVAGINSRSSGKKRVGHGGWFGGKGRSFCFGGPVALGSLVASRSSDPNDPTFTQEMLTNLLVKNDFYSKECNPHSKR